MKLNVNKIAASLSEISEEFNIKKAVLFGSYADDTCTEDSDVDLMIEFYTPQVSLCKLSGLKNSLEEKLQKRVDVIHAPIPNDSLLDIKKEIVVYEA